MTGHRRSPPPECDAVRFFLGTLFAVLCATIACSKAQASTKGLVPFELVVGMLRGLERPGSSFSLVGKR